MAELDEMSRAIGRIEQSVIGVHEQLKAGNERFARIEELNRESRQELIYLA